MAQVPTRGIDGAQNVMCVHGVDTHGHVVVKQRLSRQKLLHIELEGAIGRHMGINQRG
jgi:hypothetical protein